VALCHPLFVCLNSIILSPDGREINKKGFRPAVDKIADFYKFSDWQSKNFLKFGKI